MTDAQRKAAMKMIWRAIDSLHRANWQVEFGHDDAEIQKLLRLAAQDEKQAAKILGLKASQIPASTGAK